MKTCHEWLLVESSKLQDRKQRNCMIRNVTVDSAEIISSQSQRSSTNERRHQRAVVADTGVQRSIR